MLDLAQQDLSCTRCSDRAGYGRCRRCGEILCGQCVTFLDGIVTCTNCRRELAEAEGRVFKEHLDRFLTRALLLLGAAIIALAGLVVLTIGVYLKLAEELGKDWAAIFVGLALLLLGGVVFAIATALRGNLPGDLRGKS